MQYRPPRSSGRDRQTLIDAIAAEELALARLAREDREARAHLAALRAELNAVEQRPEVSVSTPSETSLLAPHSPADKVALFRRLFRGREDLFPTRFTSKKTGKAGYAPACRNKFRPGVCDLPRIKCGECPSQAFAPVDDGAVLAHLQGRHVMGVYPLLADDTCWFLAVDFDKGAWADDVMAFIETARRAGLPIAVERSRSGNGAHVWFFFSAPVAATTARSMGCHLITETMSRRHQLGMDSYDRLFPSQDTLPRGGFGNLIALPLQREPRRLANSVFVDDHLVPYPDDAQWTFLASLPRIDPATVASIALEASHRGTVIGVRAATSEPESAPWASPPSRRAHVARIDDPIPARVCAVLGQQLFVDKVGLPSALLDQIKRLAAFQNPEFYRKQRLRLPTATAPRVIACATELPQYIALPRGCRDALDDLLREYGAALDVDDQRAAGESLDVRFQGTLTPVQTIAMQALLAHDIGVFVAPPGVGKTVVGVALVAARRCATLILVHRRPLLDQWLAQLALFLGIDEKAIGRIGGGKRRPSGRLDVAMIQSLVRKGTVDDVIAGYGQVIVDECHHVPAVSFERVLSEAKARYIVGLTATAERRDGHHPIGEMQLGPIRFAVTARQEAARRPFTLRLIVRETAFAAAPANPAAGIQGLYAALAHDEARNRLILDDVITALAEGRSPIVLTERTDHLEFFSSRLAGFTRHLVVLRGGMGARQEREVRRQLAAIGPHEERLILATGRFIGEGFDDARLDTLFLTLPISWRGTLVQYTGRLHRLHPGKSEVRIYDYVDRASPMVLRMFEKRLRGYRAIGYARGEAPLGFAEARDTVVEYDGEYARTRSGARPIQTE